MKRARALGLVLFAAVACGGPQQLGGRGATCFRDDDCEAGMICVAPSANDTGRVCSTDATPLISMVDRPPAAAGGTTSGEAGVAGTAAVAGTGTSGAATGGTAAAGASTGGNAGAGQAGNGGAAGGSTGGTNGAGTSTGASAGTDTAGTSSAGTAPEGGAAL